MHMLVIIPGYAHPAYNICTEKVQDICTLQQSIYCIALITILSCSLLSCVYTYIHTTVVCFLRLKAINHTDIALKTGKTGIVHTTV